MPIRADQISASGTERVVTVSGGRLSETPSAPLRLPGVDPAALPGGLSDGAMFFDTTASSVGVVVGSSADRMVTSTVDRGCWVVGGVFRDYSSGAGWQDVDFPVEQVAPSGISRNASTRVFTIQRAGVWHWWVHIQWNVQNSGNADRPTEVTLYELRMTVNGTPVAGAARSCPGSAEWNVTNNPYHVHMGFIWCSSMSANDQVRIQVRYVAGDTNTIRSSYGQAAAWRLA